MGIVSTISARKCRKVFYALWVIWTARNKEAYLREIDDIDRHSPGQEIMVERWCPPDLDFIKINFDAAFNNHTKESCSGF
ncbi:hypothetical protein Gogos_003731, partial [Gossypium gossypioides]|nr:hypothetical protein [Gossypium gossypioides]